MAATPNDKHVSVYCKYWHWAAVTRQTKCGISNLYVYIISFWRVRAYSCLRIWKCIHSFSLYVPVKACFLISRLGSFSLLECMKDANYRMFYILTNHSGKMTRYLQSLNRTFSQEPASVPPCLKDKKIECLQGIIKGNRFIRSRRLQRLACRWTLEL